ncbi:MAG TPA: hypothetical protein VG737_11795 [Cyclobacteriaceae bacterium]|nr:hypothetical protein [Cyclobacteriaceae bacterium]
MKRIVTVFEKLKDLIVTRCATRRISREQQLEKVISTELFRRLNLQEKIVAVARLHAIFEMDFKVGSPRLNRKLIELNHELTKKVINHFSNQQRLS